MSKLRVGVIYGGRSVEHEVSVITALQAMNALDPSRYEIVPIYITRDGAWLTGDALRQLPTYQNLEALRALPRVALPGSPSGGLLPLSDRPRGLSLFGGSREPSMAIDVAFPCIHGTYGEDGTLQGLLEMANLPYVGSGVLASALGMDKIAMKQVFQANGLPVVAYLSLQRAEWRAKPEEIIDRIERGIGYPAFVKPANLGSSVGIGKATDRATLRQALDVAAAYDRRLIVERAVPGAVDINCSVLGDDRGVQTSVCEEPVAWQEFLSYEDKYMRGGKTQGMKGQSRRIPAPISPELTRRIQELAARAFQSIDAAGVARIDFLLAPDETVYVNEVNTLPGSLSFYLWEATDLPFPRLLDRLIEIAQRRQAERKETTYSFDSSLLRKTLEGSGKAPRR